MRGKKKYRSKKDLIRSLMMKQLKNVKFGKDWVSLEYDGKKIKNKIKIVKHEWGVGDWDRKKNIVFIDDDLKRKRDVQSVALHECIEKYVAQKYKLNVDDEAHPIAEAVEKRYYRILDGSWKVHQKKVEKVWIKEGMK